MKKLLFVLLASTGSLMNFSAAAQEQVKCISCPDQDYLIRFQATRQRDGKILVSYNIRSESVDTTTSRALFDPAARRFVRAKDKSDMEYNLQAVDIADFLKSKSITPPADSVLEHFMHYLVSRPDRKLELKGVESLNTDDENSGQSGAKKEDKPKKAIPAWFEKHPRLTMLLAAIALGLIVLLVVFRKKLPRLNLIGKDTNTSTQDALKGEGNPTNGTEAGGDNTGAGTEAGNTGTGSLTTTGATQSLHDQLRQKEEAERLAQSAAGDTLADTANGSENKKQTAQLLEAQQEIKRLTKELKTTSDELRSVRSSSGDVDDAHQSLLTQHGNLKTDYTRQQDELDALEQKAREDTAYFKAINSHLIQPFASAFAGSAYPPDIESQRLFIEFIVTMAFQMQSLTDYKLERAPEYEMRNYSHMAAGAPLLPLRTVSSSAEVPEASNIVRYVIDLLKQNGSNSLPRVLIDEYMIMP